MALRDNVYHEFGPLLMEALFDETLSELNKIRQELNLPLVPKAAFLGSAHNHLDHLDPYNWMSDHPTP